MSMASDTPDVLSGFPVVEAKLRVGASRLEEDVVALFDQMRIPVLRYLLSLRIPAPDAEEIVQEVFLALFEHLRRDRSRVNLQGWIFKVAHNAALKFRLRARRHSDRFSCVAELETATEDSSPGPEESLSARQRQQRLLAVVRALPEQDQCCLSLRAEGLRYREIAEVLGMSLGSVASSLEKSLSRLTRADRA
jgi:RNA polymerase sigma-70 factor (ECF subfamily)